jgi:hypothetical protein
VEARRKLTPICVNRPVKMRSDAGEQRKSGAIWAVVAPAFHASANATT